MSDYHEHLLNQYERQIDLLVQENDHNEKLIDQAQEIAIKEGIPSHHAYSWVSWFVEQSKANDDLSTPTVKEFYKGVKNDDIDLFLDEDDPD